MDPDRITRNGAVIVVGVDHVNEFYRVNEGYKKRHLRLKSWLHGNIAEKPVAVVEERGATGRKEAEVNAEIEGSVPKDFAAEIGSHHAFADIDPAEYARRYGTGPSDKLAEPDRSEVLAERERCIAETAAHFAEPRGSVLIVCGWEHVEGIGKLLEARGLEVRTEHLQALGIHKTDPFDLDD